MSRSLEKRSPSNSWGGIQGLGLFDSPKPTDCGDREIACAGKAISNDSIMGYSVDPRRLYH